MNKIKLQFKYAFACLAFMHYAQCHHSPLSFKSQVFYILILNSQKSRKGECKCCLYPLELFKLV
jgi:hypothetical protein